MFIYCLDLVTRLDVSLELFTHFLERRRRNMRTTTSPFCSFAVDSMSVGLVANPHAHIEEIGEILRGFRSDSYVCGNDSTADLFLFSSKIAENATSRLQLWFQHRGIEFFSLLGRRDFKRLNMFVGSVASLFFLHVYMPSSL